MAEGCGFGYLFTVCMFGFPIHLFGNPEKIFTFVCVSSHLHIGSHIREGVKEHYMHIESKPCKSKILEKLAVEHMQYFYFLGTI